MNELSLEQCYALLELNPGVSVAEIDIAYSKKVMEKIQQGAKQEKVLLKAAY
ncbi:MAG: molecular chaperone DnaJ, partial [Leptolyngbya sp. ERB_1_2]